MPMYDYVCPKCGYRETKIVRSDERNSQECPQCKEYLKIDVTTIKPNLHGVG